MRKRSFGLAVVFGCAAGLLAISARAQPRPAGAEKQATAEELFERGNAAMKAGKLHEACDLYAESYRIDKAGGTLQNLAYCYERAGLWASAFARYQDLLALAQVAVPPRPDRVALARQQLSAIKPKLSHVIVRVPAGTRAADLTVTIDGTSYEQAAWATGLLLDPGDHTAIVSAPGKRPFKSTIEVVEGRDVALVLPTLAPTPRAPGAGPPANPRPTRTAGIVVGTAGTAVLAAGAVFGALAIEKNNQGSDACRFASGKDPNQFDASGYCYRGSPAWHTANDDKSRALTYANVANVLVPVGAVALIAGAYLFFHAPPANERGARLVPTLGGAAVVGAF